MLRFISGFLSLTALAGVIGTSTVHAEPESPDYSPDKQIYFEWQNSTRYRYIVDRTFKSDCIYDEITYIVVDHENDNYIDISECLDEDKPAILTYEIKQADRGNGLFATVKYVKNSSDRASIDITYTEKPYNGRRIDWILAYCGGQPCSNKEVHDKPHPNYYEAKIDVPGISPIAGIGYHARISH